MGDWTRIPWTASHHANHYAMPLPFFEYNNNLLSSRFREADEDSSNRIIRVMEAKPNAKQDHNRMIDIEYTKDEAGDQNVDVSS